MAQQPLPRKPLTHFLCIPLATRVGRPQLVDSLAAFHADVAVTAVPLSRGGGGGGGGEAGTTRGILPSAALRPVGTLHLTLGVLSLDPNGTGPDSLHRAKAVLASLGRPQGSSDGDGGSSDSIRVSLRGLHAMQPPARASVLYAAPVDASTGRPAGAGGPLLALCERVRAAFADLLLDDGRPLLLHATLVNTVYVRDGRRGGRGGRGGGGRGGSRGGSRGGARDGGRGSGKLTFDARTLLDRYDDYVWMDQVPVDTVALCQMGAKPTAVDDDGDVVDAAYPVEAAVQV